VADLEPRSRALLELAARRGMSDAEMAALLRVRKTEVERLREQATQQLAVVLKLEGGEFEGLREELTRLDEEDWERRAVLRAGQPGSAGRQGRTRIVAAGAVLLALAGIAGVLATRGNHDKHVATGSAAAITPQRGPAVPFQPLNGTHGRGSVRLIREPSRAQVRLRVVGLLRPQAGATPSGSTTLPRTHTGSRSRPSTTFTEGSAFHAITRATGSSTSRERFPATRLTAA
jgi:hypothetical protein